MHAASSTPSPSAAHLVGPQGRQRALDQLGDDTFDLFVIGGGVTGAGLASAAARAGLKVGLCEACDFGAGTSSRSSKLIHGGLRYLESLEFRLVRQSARERKEIYGQAPHLAEPRWMIAPFRGWWQKLVLRLGISIYEWLGGVDHADRQQHWSREVLDQRVPGLCPEQYQEAIAYREYSTDDARLVLALVRDAKKRGAKVLNYLPCEKVRIRDSEIIELDLRCAVSDQPAMVRAHCVVNAAGPWVDHVIAQEAGPQDPVVQLSRGSHIIVPADRLPVQDLMMLRAQDQRRFFVMRRGDVVHIGTTDILQTEKASYWPQVTKEEVNYLLDATALHFPQVQLETKDIVGAWAGLRPLVRRPETQNADAGKISRADEVIDHGRGFVTIAGGKLTGYPGMARRVLGQVARKLRRNVYALTQPSMAPLPGGDFDGDFEKLARRLRDEYPILTDEQAQRLIRFYGTESFAMLAYGLDLVPGCPEIFSSEIYWAFEVEGAVSLEDVVFRRLRLFYAFAVSPTDAKDRLGAIAAQCAQLQGWSSQRVDIELNVAIEALRSETGAFADLTTYRPAPKEIPNTAPFANLGL